MADIAVGNMINRFIPEELAIAPAYPAGYPPHLTLREVSIDGNTSVQIWSPKSDAILLPEEVNLLRSDRLRVEVICSRLVWLLGANCSENDDYLGANDKLIYQWEDVTYFAGKYGFNPNVIDILFCPSTIRPIYGSSVQRFGKCVPNTPIQWVMEPACWEIFFLEIKAVVGGFKAEPRSQLLSVIVWTGQPISKTVVDT